MPETQDSRRSPVWPAEPAFLTNTSLCPACFSPLGSAVCANCGLDLAVPEATALLAAGTAVHQAETGRQRLIGRMRLAQDERARAARRQSLLQEPPPPLDVPRPSLASTGSASTPLFTPAQPVPPMFTAPVQGVPAARTPSSGMPAGPPPNQQPGPSRPRRRGIQILMLTVGVLLVSIMAVFFVLLAYLVASLEVRSVLTGLASIAVFGIAVLLQRRRLHGTAEGITVLAVVLFLLDLWIVHANGLFGTEDLDGWLYTGIALGVLTGLLALAALAVPVRALSLSAVLLGPVCAFALVQGLLAGLDPWTRGWTALTAVGLGALLWPRLRLPAERTILRSVGFGATVLAGFAAIGAIPDLAVGSTTAMALLAGVWVLTLVAGSTATAEHALDAVSAMDSPMSEPATTPVGAVADRPLPVRADAWSILSAIGLGLVASGAGLTLVTRGDVEEHILWLPAAATALAAVVVAALTRVSALRDLRPSLRLAVWFPLGFAAIASVPAMATSAVAAGWGITTRPFSLTAFESPSATPVPLEFDGPLALLLVSGLALAALWALGMASRMGWIPAVIGGLGLVAAAAVIGRPVPSTLCLAALATAQLVCVALVRSTPLRAASGVVFAVALVAFGTIGLAGSTTFPVTAVASVALLVAARQVCLRSLPSAVGAGVVPAVTGSAVIAVILSSRLLPVWFEEMTGTTTSAAGPAVWMTVPALLLAIGAPFATAVLARAELAVITGIAALTTGFGLTELGSLDLPTPLIAVLLLTAVAGVVWQLNRRVVGWPERLVAAAVAPAAIAWAIALAWTRFGPEFGGLGIGDTAPVVFAATIVLLAACGVPLFRKRDGQPGTHPARIGWDASLATAAGILLVSIVTIGEDLAWLTLTLLAVAALLVASGGGGIISGSGRRRHIAWFGLPLAVAGLWLGLFRAEATLLELYTLPVAGLLLVLLALTLVRRPATGTGRDSGRTALLVAALGVGLAPSAVLASDGQTLRSLVVLAAAAALVLFGSFAPPRYRGLECGLVLWLAGAAVAALTGLARATTLGSSDSRVPFECWAAGSAAVLLAGGLLWHLRGRSPAVLGTVAVAAAVLVFSLPSAGRLVSGDVDVRRALLVLGVTCGFIVVGYLRDEFAPALRWVSIGSAALLAGMLVVTGTADPFELATVPVALALLLGGWVLLARSRYRSSWPTIGPGLLLLLLPSLASDLDFSNDLWRVVTLGIVALAVLAAGLALRLQAPTLIGAVVVVSHGLAQLWPWIAGLYGTVPWWLWAGIGGVILIVLAATYESRIRDLKAVGRGISSLR